jgi:hypothetical protein
MSGTPALPNVGGPWVSHRQSFRIEVPCNISCNISRRIGASAGQSRLLTARRHSLEKDKAAGQKPPDLRLWWWPGAGSNRRPSDFQSEFPADRSMVSVLMPLMARSGDRGLAADAELTGQCCFGFHGPIRPLGSRELGVSRPR